MDGLDLDSLEGFLVRAGVPVDGPVRASLIGGGKSNLTFRVQDDRHRWIVRRPPLGGHHPGAHDVAREHRVMAGLAASAVPVPAMVALCEDPGVIGAPFYVMDEVPGAVLRTRDEVEALDVPARRSLSAALIDTLATLHDVDIDAVGLRGLGRPDGYLTRQLDRWHRQYRATSDRHSVDVSEIARRLGDTMPESPAPAIVHGDYRLDNVILTPGNTVAAVLDWEMATLGDPLADLATLVMFWDEPGRPFNPISGGLTALPGFHTGDEVVARYAEKRRLSEGQVAGLQWYLTFARFKLAVILEQIHVRHVAGQTRGEGFDGIDRMVDQLLDECLAPVA